MNFETRSGRLRKMHGHVVLEKLMQYNLGNPKNIKMCEYLQKPYIFAIILVVFLAVEYGFVRKLCLPCNTPMAPEHDQHVWALPPQDVGGLGA